MTLVDSFPLFAKHHHSPDYSDIPTGFNPSTIITTSMMMTMIIKVITKIKVTNNSALIPRVSPFPSHFI